MRIKTGQNHRVLFKDLNDPLMTTLQKPIFQNFRTYEHRRLKITEQQKHHILLQRALVGCSGLIEIPREISRQLLSRTEIVYPVNTGSRPADIVDNTPLRAYRIE